MCGESAKSSSACNNPSEIPPQNVKKIHASDLAITLYLYSTTISKKYQLSEFKSVQLIYHNSYLVLMLIRRAI